MRIISAIKRMQHRRGQDRSEKSSRYIIAHLCGVYKGGAEKEKEVMQIK